VALGEAAVFRCGVPEASPRITFNFSGNIGNYSLKCPLGHVKDIPHVGRPPEASLTLAPSSPQ